MYDLITKQQAEFESGILPIMVKRPFPKKKEGVLKKLKAQKIGDAELEQKEVAEEEEIAKEGEIMELANPDDEDSGGDEAGEE